jgi:hypothetical protein
VAKIAADGKVQKVISLPLQTMEMVLQHDCAMVGAVKVLCFTTKIFCYQM